MRRLLALAAAVAMIAGALFLRDALDDDGGEESGSRGGGGGTTVIVCATELAAACDALEADGVQVRVEPAGATADSLIAGEAELDGWVTIAPYPQMVAEARQRAAQGPVLDEGEPTVLARTPIVLVGAADRMAALERTCGSPPYWRCVGEHAGDGRGDTVTPGHDAPDESATGLVVLASAATDYFGRADFSTADFDDSFNSWFRRLERSIPQFGSPFGSLVDHLIVRPSTFDAVGALEAEAEGKAESARGQGLAILYPAAMATADAVLAWAPDRTTDRFDHDVREALQGTGWRPPDDPALPATNGLPPAGVTEALRSLWGDVVL